MHGRGYKVPELLHINVYGFCPEIRTIYEFMDVIFTLTRIKRSVTSSPRVAIHYRNGTSGRCRAVADKAIGLAGQGPKGMRV